jgi:tetratricopeptide (TPR) repeat protein
MGRPEKSLDAVPGALQDLAAGLRQLRANDGGRSYRQLAKRANFAPSTLARAASGRALPSWDLTEAYVLACGGDPDHWRPLWTEASRGVVQATETLRQLPADLRDFVGRATELDALVQAACDVDGRGNGGAPVTVVITGPGGIGKTSLAVHAAHRLAENFPDGQLFEDLRACDEYQQQPEQVASRLVAALGDEPSKGVAPLAALRSRTAGRRLLVVLDNAATVAQVLPLLPASSGCLVLVTSRHALGGLSRAWTLQLGPLDRGEGVDLLTRVAGARSPARPDDVTSMVELCGRFPLALRVAGARLAGSPAGKAEWLLDRLRHDENPLRHLTVGDLDLTTVFGLSYRLLPELSRRVFRYAGLFPGVDFTPHVVAVLSGIDLPDVESALAQLTNANLVLEPIVGRHQMHDLLRLYAKDRVERDEPATLRSGAIRRLAAWYLAAVDATDRMFTPDRRRPEPLPPPARGPDPSPADKASAANWYDLERANLVAVTRAAARSGHHDIAWRFPVAMRGLMDLRGHIDDWITTHQIGLQSARLLGDHDGEGWVLNGLGIAHWRREEYAEAIDCYQEALALRAAAADPRGVAVALNNLGNVFGAQGRHIEAIACLREALAIHDVLGEPLDRSFALHNLGHLHHDVGHFAEALPLLQEALHIRRRLGSSNSEAVTLHCLGDTLTGLGRHVEALACFRRALATFRDVGNRFGEAAALHSVGGTCRTIGKPRHATRYLARAASLYRALDDQAHAEMAEAAHELAQVEAGPA